jgi:translation initiation factor 2 gamma subunit (eIF-2gamma)
LLIEDSPGIPNDFNDRQKKKQGGYDYCSGITAKSLIRDDEQDKHNEDDWDHYRQVSFVDSPGHH